MDMPIKNKTKIQFSFWLWRVLTWVLSSLFDLYECWNIKWINLAFQINFYILKFIPILISALKNKTKVAY